MLQATLDPIRTDLTRSLSPRLDGQVDLLLFNPPYVPTEGEELEVTQRAAGVGATWAGGANGMHVTQKVLEDLPVSRSATDHWLLSDQAR